MAWWHWSDDNRLKQQSTGEVHEFGQHWSIAGALALKMETRTSKTDLCRGAYTVEDILDAVKQNPEVSTRSPATRRACTH